MFLLVPAHLVVPDKGPVVCVCVCVCGEGIPHISFLFFILVSNSSSSKVRKDKDLRDTHTHTFNGTFSGTTRVSRYQKGKTNLDFTGARDSEWQWHQLGHMQDCSSLHTDNQASTPPLSFLQAGCPSCHPTNSVKALKEMRELLVKANMFLWATGPLSFQSTIMC